MIICKEIITKINYLNIFGRLIKVHKKIIIRNYSKSSFQSPVRNVQKCKRKCKT